MPAAKSLLDAIDEFERVAFAEGFGLDGLVVKRVGEPAIKRRWTPEIRRDIFSISKTFTSVAIGIAEGEGLLGVEDHVLEHLPEFASSAAPGVARITLRHLLMMTSGIVYRWADEDNDHPGDPAQDILSTELATDPGSAFEYRGANPYLLSRVIHAVSGVDLRDYLLPRLFHPLGIRNPQWMRDPLGYSIAAMGLQLRTEEIARLATALLDGGRYEGRQLIPEEYVGSMSSDLVAVDWEPMRATGYGRGLWVWQPGQDWRMDGLYGQLSIGLPLKHASITVTAGYDSFDTTVIVDAMHAIIAPAA